MKNTLEEKNRLFNNMSKTEKRISIARDVIEQIRLKNFTAQCGDYFEIDLYEKHEFKEEGEVELQSLFDEGAIKKCSVCAIGSLFASKVSLGNNFKMNVSKSYWSEGLHIDESINDTEIIKNLRGIFSPKELRIIEFAFEGQMVSFDYDISGKAEEKLKSYYTFYKNDSDRMVAIMENIIKNEGKFIPEECKKQSKKQKL